MILSNYYIKCIGSAKPIMIYVKTFDVTDGDTESVILWQGPQPFLNIV